LVGSDGGLFAVLRRLFGGRPRLFAASAIADKIDRGLLISRQVLDRRNPSPIDPGSRLHEAVSNQLREHAISAYTRADNALDGIDDSMKQESAWLDEARPEEILSTLETKLEDKRVNLHVDLLPCAHEMMKARITWEEFKYRNALPDDVDWGKRYDLAVFGQVGILLLFEFVANALFQSDTQQTGLIGGVLVATLTSIATILLGVLFGSGRQLTHRTVKGGGWTGGFLIALAFMLSYVFVSLLSLVRVAGESGNLHPLEAARMQLMGDPFAGVRAMLDLPAFAYTLCIVALIVIVMRKFLAYNGIFPGARKRMMSYLDAQEAFEDQYDDEIADVKVIAHEHSQLLEAAPAFIVSCKVPIQTLVADHENVVEQHLHDTDDIKGAGRLFAAFVREHCDEETRKLVSLPEQDTLNTMEGHRQKLDERHSAFAREAAELCAREDVSQRTIAAARDRFNDVVEAKLGELALEKQRMLELALKEFKDDKTWRADVLALSAAKKHPVDRILDESTA
jgi:hypothetical protein